MKQASLDAGMLQSLPGHWKSIFQNFSVFWRKLLTFAAMRTRIELTGWRKKEKTMLTMAKRAATSHVGKHRETITVSPKLLEAIDAYIESLRPEPSRTAVWQVAMEDFLAAHGFWEQEKDDD
jgi:hypothetical protein